MHIAEVARRLLAQGLQIEDSDVNGAARIVHLVRLEGGQTIAMFHADAEDLLEGSATLSQIVARNAGADVCDPWPSSAGRRRPRGGR